MTAREQLKSIYAKSKRWAAKVDKMTDAQVIAVLIRMKQRKATS